MMRFIILNGPPRCGKDTAQKLLPGYKEKLSAPLKAAVTGVFDPLELLEEGLLEKLKDGPMEVLMGSTYRQEQIEMFRYLALRFGEDVLGKLMLQRLKTLEPLITASFDSLVTVSDGGRRAEYFPLIEKFGKENVLVIQIHRDSCSFTDIRQYCDLTDVGVATIRVENNGSIIEYEERLKSAIAVAKPGWLRGLLI